jgi:hypothetical protein
VPASLALSVNLDEYVLDLIQTNIVVAMPAQRVLDSGLTPRTRYADDVLLVEA